MQLLAKGESFPYYCIYLYRKFGEVGIYKAGHQCRMIHLSVCASPEITRWIQADSCWCWLLRNPPYVTYPLPSSSFLSSKSEKRPRNRVSEGFATCGKPIYLITANFLKKYKEGMTKIFSFGD